MEAGREEKWWRCNEKVKTGVRFQHMNNNENYIALTLGQAIF